ncbi:glycosyltransferase family 2 protein [Streptomyces niveiscabiei]|uniref:glycosyltransferase family 2 protein n=1 Tax=Streptomyces niveiscabiei TaxID=164115 RepID=UPI0006EBB7B0|nr:glycosyltransferase family 2 protein [Streptomyces niveiscabiei]
MPKLSVIVPCYNVQHLVLDTLRSLQANAREDFEFVLVDDKSKDDTAAVLERAAETLGKVSQVQVVRPEKNGGLATARNNGLNVARGEYLTFLDGDDWYARGFLAELVDSIEKLGCDFVRVDHVQTTARARAVFRHPEGRRNVVLNPRDSILPPDRSTSVDYPYAWAGVYHRRLVDQGLLHFTDGLRTAEDRPWIWKLHREAESFAVADLHGIFYRRGVANSLTQIGDVRQLDFIRAFDQVIEETSKDPDADRLLPKAVRTYLAIIAHHLSEIEKFEPPVAKLLRVRSAAAMQRLPQELLTDVLDTMDIERSAKLRRLRRKVTTAKAAA